MMSRGALAGLRILLAEDDPFIASSLEDMLSGHGARVITLNRVSDLLKVQAADHDVALLDLGLVDGDVGAAAERLRRNGLPVVLQTGRELDELPRGQSRELILTKPVAEERLVSLLASLMG